MNKNDNKKITAHENESVTLCAVVSSERANVRWLRGDQLLNQDNIHISSEGKTHKLTINPLQLFDSGEYVCDVITDRMSFSLLVKGNEFSCIKCIFLICQVTIPVLSLVLIQTEMKVKFLRPLENTVCLRGGSLTLRCEINKPKGDVQWLKNGQEIPAARRHTILAQGRERTFTIHQVAEGDAGEYACESTDDRTSATVRVEGLSKSYDSPN